MLDEAKKSSSSGSAVLSELSGGGAKAPLSASGYGLFDDAPQHDDSSERAGLVAPLGSSARIPAVLRSEVRQPCSLDSRACVHRRAFPK